MHDAREISFPKDLPIDLGKYVWRLHVTGEHVALASTLIEDICHPYRGRGGVTSFSRASRKRMLTRVAQINWKKVKCGLFITLTWPDERWYDWRRLKNQARSQFLRDLEYLLDRKINALWRIEWKPRLSGRYTGKYLPHFHLIVPNVRFIHKDKIKSLWTGAVGASDEIITWIDRLENKKKHSIYIAKYCAKVPGSDVLDNVTKLNMKGRHWGTHRPELLPVHTTVEFNDLPLEVVALLRGRAQLVLPWYDAAKDKGFSVFGQFGKSFAKSASELVLDAGCVSG